jgi:hypothetical protein
MARAYCGGRAGDEGDAFRPEAARWARETYEFHVGVDAFHGPVDDGVSEPEYEPAFEPDLVVRIDLHTFLSLISGWSRRTP